MFRTFILASASAFALASFSVTPASALTMKECSAKYQDAKKANTLKGQKWNDFRKAQCGDDDANDADAAAAVPDTPAPTAAAPAAKPAGKAKAAVFPKAVSQKYSNESAGKARLKTCADQYNANKAANANGELKWIEKGGGYWSQCNTKLKS
ncbi:MULTISPECIES: hypothetical protein [Bosea]|uniref:hypothetical protein n=1 Tax=Bosea TaxID=85413 RepID=UPI00214FCE65|nr:MULTISPECIES: hypothetical protein [Bosea]MCR4524702.1 hypothetical protein [Bosea sp. 47.2.35]MDR6831529.1 hypothetical protein [Bosea robiniae]MDR6898238.1 hypothetical protein [Bosea sp. BE109]MDR7141635.1 hypothetical protein [Bosea sp. BE168]MDR7178258.1 hypothetical protein [Bosea sp. BE271]